MFLDLGQAKVLVGSGKGSELTCTGMREKVSGVERLHIENWRQRSATNKCISNGQQTGQSMDSQKWSNPVCVFALWIYLSRPFLQR